MQSKRTGGAAMVATGKKGHPILNRSIEEEQARQNRAIILVGKWENFLIKIHTQYVAHTQHWTSQSLSLSQSICRLTTNSLLISVQIVRISCNLD